MRIKTDMWDVVFFTITLAVVTAPLWYTLVPEGAWFSE